MEEKTEIVSPAADNLAYQSVTRNDVARYAGVSPATVSNVVNNKNIVAGEKKRRVLEAIEKLGYQPNLIARSLKTKETKQVGLISNDITNQFYAEIALGMEDEAQKSGFTVCMMSAKDINFNKTVLKRQFDGLLLATDTIPVEEINSLAAGNIPIVFIGNEGYHSVDPRVAQILMDIYGGAYQLFDYLLQNGHSRIGFISARLLKNEEEPDYRFKAYTDVLRKYAMPIDHSLISIQIKSLEEVYSITKKMISMEKRPTVIFAGNDHNALAVYSAINEHGLRIPDDISVAGFDNLLISNYLYPRLTTVDLPKYNLGQKAMQVLLKKIRRETVDNIIMNTSLIIRNSARKLS